MKSHSFLEAESQAQRIIYFFTYKMCQHPEAFALSNGKYNCFGRGLANCVIEKYDMLLHSIQNIQKSSI